MLQIKTNNVQRDSVYGYELTQKERDFFDYYAWDEIQHREFIRYKGTTYDIGEFIRVKDNSSMPGWDGYYPDSFFSGVVIKLVDDKYIIGTYFS